MDVNEFRRAGHAAVEEIAAYYEKLQLGGEGFQVAPSMKPGDLFKQIPESPPNEPTPFEEVQKDFDKLILPATCHWQHPSFYAYFPANSTFESIIADMYATATSTPGFNHSCNPAATELEQAMTSWVGQMLGLDKSLSTNGVIQTTASDGAIIACVAARERNIKYLLAKEGSKYKTREEIHSKLVMYGSTQTHSLGAKAGLVLGIPFRAIETYAEDDWALTGASLEKAIEEDQGKGLIPFMLISTIGSTSSGTVDKLAELCEVAKKHPEIYIHVDAAWAGVYLALPEERLKLGLDAVNKRGEQDGEFTWGEVHSFCTNLHKNGLVAFDCSTFFIRDSKLLTEVLDLTPPFLKNQGGYGQVTDYRNWGLSLGRRFRSLKILFVLRSYGVQGFQAHLQRTIELGKTFEEQVVKDDNFEIVTPRSLSLVVFRLKPKGEDLDEEALNALNKKFYARLHKHTSIQLTSTIIGNTFCIRFVPGSPWTREEHVLAAWKVIRETGEGELAAGQQ